MKLLVVSHSCATAANQELYVEIERQTGWGLTILVPAEWKDEFGNVLNDAPAQGLRARVVKVPVWKNGSIVFHLYRKRWKPFLDRERFDAIYVNHEPYAVATAQLCLANRRSRSPAAFGFYSCQNIRKSYPPPFSWMERQVYRSSSFAFPITHDVAEVLRAKGYRGGLAVCPLPFDPNLCIPRSVAENEGRIPRAAGEVIIGYIGRLVESKGLQTLANALAKIADLPWKLVVIGKGAYAAAFHSHLHASGLSHRSTFLGYVPHSETPRYLSAMDILVVPSETQLNWKEQFGRVITEAMACGTAVVGSDSGEIPNLIRQSGCGLVFPERNADAFAAALRQMIESEELRQVSAEKGRAWVTENVCIKAVAAKMAETMGKAEIAKSCCNG